MGIRVLKAVLGNLWKLARPLVPRLPQRIQRVLVIIPLCVLFLFLWLSIRNLSVSSNEQTNERTNEHIFWQPQTPVRAVRNKTPLYPHSPATRGPPPEKYCSGTAISYGVSGRPRCTPAGTRLGLEPHTRLHAHAACCSSCTRHTRYRRALMRNRK